MVITLKLCVVRNGFSYIHETLHLSKYDKFSFVVSWFYHTPFKSYGPDYNQTTDIEDRFWTRGQFANQATILDLLSIVPNNFYPLRYNIKNRNSAAESFKTKLNSGFYNVNIFWHQIYLINYIIRWIRVWINMNKCTLYIVIFFSVNQ